ncbi:MAG: transcriptional antiterminator [Deltaproteobacteria bacterium]|nr:MAG: transcriptional antiterminator [Deltaproteobacteria bacterium]
MHGTRLTPAWYVLHTKSRFENTTCEALARKAVEVFLPKILVQSRRRDRRVMLRACLFPGYLFVKTDLNPSHHLEILKTVGAVRLIGNRQGPLPVSPETIDSLKIITATDQQVTTGSRFKKGDQVVVIRGAFTGVIGIFSQYRGKNRVIVHIETLGQFAAVEVDEDDVELLHT